MVCTSSDLTRDIRLVRERRRRAGIPDEDKRPFNIAYNAAALARRERDDERRKREAAEAAAASPPESDWRQLGRTLGIPQDRPPIPYGEAEGRFYKGRWLNSL